MMRFLCFRPFCKRPVKVDVDSERAESAAFVADAEDPAIDDLAFGRLGLRDPLESSDSYDRGTAGSRTALWCDQTTVPITDMWRDEPPFMFRQPAQALRTPPVNRTVTAPVDRTVTAPVDWTITATVDRTVTAPDDMTITAPYDRTVRRTLRTFPSYKDSEKRKNPGADMPAEKKARREPSAYIPAIPESESD